MSVIYDNAWLYSHTKGLPARSITICLDPVKSVIVLLKLDEMSMAKLEEGGMTTTSAMYRH